jgi:hypothetical protein
LSTRSLDLQREQVRLVLQPRLKALLVLRLQVLRLQVLEVQNLVMHFL